MPKLIDLTGKKFGRLVVLKRIENDRRGNPRWLCKCDCGEEKIILGYHLRNGDTRSCGCMRKEVTRQRSTKHGYARRGEIARIYYVWYSMKQRCINSNNHAYSRYGGNGIIVCEEWLIFANFLEDMIKGWEPGLTLERTDNKLGYSKDNCEWATYKKQNRNKQNSCYVEYSGKNRLLIELCEEHNMSYKLVWARIFKYGWTPKEALTIPIRQRRKK